MRKTIDILGIPVDSITMGEALSKVESFLEEDVVHTIFTPNAEILMQAQRDPELGEILCNSDMLVADGAGVVLASRILGRSVPEKVSGIDLVKRMFGSESMKTASYFLFGSKPGVADMAARNIMNTCPGVRISGCMNGYFSKEEEQGIIDTINASNADILLVALGAPGQEKWINRNKHRLNVKVCMGVGGTLDVLAGVTRPTPEFIRRIGLEWLHRLYKEPRRYKRMMDLPRFMIRVLRERLSG